MVMVAGQEVRPPSPLYASVEGQTLAENRYYSTIAEQFQLSRNPDQLNAQIAYATATNPNVRALGVALAEAQIQGEQIVAGATSGAGNVVSAITKPIADVGKAAAEAVGNLEKNLLLIFLVGLGVVVLLFTSKSGQILSAQATPLLLIAAGLIGFLFAPEFFPVNAAVSALGLAMQFKVV